MKIDHDHLPLASQNAIVAEALIRSTHENLLDFLDDKQMEAQVQLAVTGVANLNSRVGNRSHSAWTSASTPSSRVSHPPTKA